MTDEERSYCLHLLHHFKIEGRFADEMASDGQIEIFHAIIFRTWKRLQILCSTQYGKSLFVALACIVVACVQHEMVAVIAPSDAKAKIIMRYFIEHLGDHPVFERELEKDSKLDRLRMEETKERITMKRGGGIFMIAVNATASKGVESAMGAGARIVVEDESGLIPDQIESTVFRMIAGKGPDAFYCKIGNPFYLNHFHRSWDDPAYHKVFIDAERGLKEGRYTEAFLAEARRKPLYSILYECKFPSADMVDEKGFLQLIPEARMRVIDWPLGAPWFAPRILGVDPAGEGKDEATWCLRDRFKAKIIHSEKTSNPRKIAEITLTLMAGERVDPENTVIDAMGVGADVGKEIALATKGQMEVYTVLAGNRPVDEEEYNGRFFRRTESEIGDKDDDLYMNLRALMYFRARTWIFAGGELADENGDNSPFKGELSVIKYKRSLQGNKIQLMSKRDMQLLGIPSPNKADAFALTFLRDAVEIGRQTKEEVEAIKAEEEEIGDRFAAL